MRVVVLTSLPRGLASYCIPRLAKEPKIELAMIVYNEGRPADPRKQRRRKIRKMLKIGPLGALNGVRMRPWFGDDVSSRLKIEGLDTVADRCGIRLERTPTINCQRTVDLFTEAGAELGLSLGNPYIGQQVYSIPGRGMINIHHEVLPRFQGAQSVIWQIYEGSTETGYTIHRIDDHIDTGDILYQETMPIRLHPTLGETVSANVARLYEASAEGLVDVINNFTELAASAKPQAGGRSFTTPTYWQYLRMVRQHRRLYRERIE
jgi:methionyl-tRNA formyltransferase